MISRCRVMAPIRSTVPSRVIPASPATRFRSMIWSGKAKRMFSIGISDWPPASRRAFSKLPSKPTVSAIVGGGVIVEDGGLHEAAASKAWMVRGMIGSTMIAPGCCNASSTADAIAAPTPLVPPLAGAFDAQRVQRAGRVLGNQHVDRGHLRQGRDHDNPRRWWRAVARPRRSGIPRTARRPALGRNRRRSAPPQAIGLIARPTSLATR